MGLTTAWPVGLTTAWPAGLTPAWPAGLTPAWPAFEEAEPPGWMTRQDLSSQRPGGPQEPRVPSPAAGVRGWSPPWSAFSYLSWGAGKRVVWRCLHRTIEDCPLKYQCPCSQPSKGRLEEGRVRAEENHPATLLRAQMGMLCPSIQPRGKGTYAGQERGEA